MARVKKNGDIPLKTVHTKKKRGKGEHPREGAAVKKARGKKGSGNGPLNLEKRGNGQFAVFKDEVLRLAERIKSHKLEERGNITGLSHDYEEIIGVVNETDLHFTSEI